MTTDTTSKNIILTGFMGTGKTTIGRLLAARLERPFVDMDDQLQAHFGKPIREVFAQEGEGVFRTAEAQLCAQLSEQTGLVISTGGGALVSADNRAVLGKSGVLLCLTANVDEILRRVASTGERPLLNVPESDQRQRSRTLLQSRRAA